MYMLFVFGREVEKIHWPACFISFFTRFCFHALTPLTVWGFGQRADLPESPALHFGIFVAFATIYPSVELFLRITAKWMVLILAAIYTLQLLAYHSWTDLAVFWTSIACCFCFVRLRWGRTGVGLVGEF